jgi:photosystem II stability/assembly factor-like uncharacterized protein
VRLVLRALPVVAVALVATQSGAAAPPSPVPDQILFWNTHVGLLSADQGKHGVVELTNDGGHAYRVVLRTRRPIYLLQTFGYGGALVAAYSGENWRTLDGGRTWQRTPSGLISATWLNPLVGVRFRGSDSQGGLTMFVTHDGGQKWQRGRTPCGRPDIAFNAVADLVTAKLWWVVCVGEGGAGNEDKAIYRTRNGGETWVAGAASVFTNRGHRAHGGLQTYGYPDGVAFAPSGWGLLTESRGTLYVTRDGGIHFHAEPKVARPEIDFAGGAAAFPGGAGYVFLGEAQPRLLATHDYGRTWHLVHRWRG